MLSSRRHLTFVHEKNVGFLKVALIYGYRVSLQLLDRDLAKIYLKITKDKKFVKVCLHNKQCRSPLEFDYFFWTKNFQILICQFSFKKLWFLFWKSWKRVKLTNVFLQKMVGSLAFNFGERKELLCRCCFSFVGRRRLGFFVFSSPRLGSLHSASITRVTDPEGSTLSKW